ncbi:tRNA (guanosine(46)-N7)-methyltransferase TrmB [Microscilla marina]|uniref:tRNA (guanine-N(7)-)-methyltransferase n=1 Tax=Microscilla marina ATCC 23134 TaxID=313606 RepID=A1ZJK7_MICM2|nr:tRNA (guanosine(46)-N7)-methyltransferase TrmB [Microscilla marina]EAY29310.1 tRNA (guanine-N(7)-)-methyltransferase [Microscilla marina ATCC 23134]
MGRRNKLERFKQNEENPNVVQPGKPLYDTIKGKWREEFFKNDRDIVLELACGRGEYTVGLAQAYPDRNFVGVDIKGDRIWKGSQFATQNGLQNVGFLRTFIQNIEQYFAPGEVNEIWVVHPDPRPKDSDERRRLTNARFLTMYKNLLTTDGWLHFKTDNAGLFEYTLEVLKDWKIKDFEFTRDLYKEEKLLAQHHDIKTRYELKFVAEGHKIHYLKFRFDRGEG